jgi:glycosyltransferase involved in cell wall biosynthesis
MLVRRRPHFDVAIYAPHSRGLYDRALGRSGGAERQMVLLARSLAERGHRVAHIVYPVHDPIELPDGLTLVPRAPYTRDESLDGRVKEAVRIWRSLARADAPVVVVRTGTPAVGIAALDCLLRRRRLIFSGANTSDFTLERLDDRWYRRPLYVLGVRLADTIVVQSTEQRDLARRAFPSLRRLVEIPSFAEPAPDSAPAANEDAAFLWVGRLVDYKRPECYVELARAIPDARFRMIPVPAERSAFPLLERLRAEAEGVANLELVEPLPHERALELIGSSVAVVSTARLEGMPNVFLEAWFRGVPVLTLEFDPDRVIAREGLGVAAESSWERFVDGARQLWRDRDSHSEFAERARRYVAHAHSIESVGARWSGLITERSSPDGGAGPERR